MLTIISEAAEKKAAAERYAKLQAQGKTTQAKTDLARLQEIRKRREAAAAQRIAEQEGECRESRRTLQSDMRGWAFSSALIAIIALPPSFIGIIADPKQRLRARLLPRRTAQSASNWRPQPTQQTLYCVYTARA
jgi:hypothetical protein